MIGHLKALAMLSLILCAFAALFFLGYMAVKVSLWFLLAPIAGPFLLVLYFVAYEMANGSSRK